MTRTDDTSLFEWIDAAAEGTLADADRARLERALDARPELATERTIAHRLHRLLATDRIPVREGFARRVAAEITALTRLDHLLATDRIPVREGFAQRVRSAIERDTSAANRAAWHVPVALAAGLLVAATFLMSAGGGVAGSLGTFAAVADFFQTATLTGAGLLGATWQGITIAFDEMLVGSRSSIVALIVGVVCLDLLFVRMLRRRPRAAAIGRDTEADRR